MPLTQFLHARGAMGISALQTAALAPPLLAIIWQNGTPTLVLFTASMAIASAWDIVFCLLRRRPFEPQGITTAMILTLFAPPEIPLWHLAVVLSLGVVIGERAFGGRGFSFLSAAVVALALALLSLPDLALPVPSPAVVLACLPGLVLLTATGLFSLSTALAFTGVLAIGFGPVLTPDPALMLSVLPALLFLVDDPNASATTTLGRVLYGGLAGGLVWVFSGTGGTGPTPDALVFAALMASILAPLLDHIAVHAYVTARRRRHG